MGSKVYTVIGIPRDPGKDIQVICSSGGGTKKVDVVLGDESQGATEAAEASSRWKPRTAKHQRKGSLVKDRQGSTALPYHSRQLDQDLPQDGAGRGRGGDLGPVVLSPNSRNSPRTNPKFVKTIPDKLCERMVAGVQ